MKSEAEKYIKASQIRNIESTLVLQIRIENCYRGSIEEYEIFPGDEFKL